MAAHPGPLSEAGAESSLQEVNWQLRSQLEKTGQDFLDLNKKFLVSEVTAYSLANQLQKHKCEKSSDLIKSMLGEKVLCEKGKRADMLPEKLRLCHLLIQDQAKELTHLYKKLREGEEVSHLLLQHLEALLIHDGAEHSQGQGLRGQLAEGRRLAKCLARKLSPENYDHEGDDDDNDDEEEEEGEETTLTIVQYNQMDQEGLKGQDSVAPRLTTQLLEQDTSRDTPDEHYLTYSVLPDLSDSYWPYKSSAIFSPEDPQVCSSLQVAKYQLNHEEEENQDPLCPRPSTKLLEVEEQDAQGDSLDECYLTYSALPDLADLQGTSTRAGINSFDEMDNSSALAIARIPNDLFEEEDQDPLGPRPSTKLPEVEEQDAQGDSLDECYLTYLALPDLADLQGTSTRAGINSFDDMDNSSALAVARIPNDLFEEEDQDPLGPRPSLCLPEVEEQDPPWVSLDQCYLTHSAFPDLADLHGTSTRADRNSFDDMDNSSALKIAIVENHNDLLEVEDQDLIYPSPPCNSRLCTELPMVEENDVPQDSLDECHLTSSTGHHLPDTWRPCTSASSTHDKEETFEGLDVVAPMQSPCHQGPSSGNLTFSRAQVQSSGAQTQPSTPEADSLQLQLHQHLDRGDNRARLSLSSAIGSLGTNMGSGDPPPLLRELALDASMGMKNPPKLERDVGEDSRDRQHGCQIHGHMKALGVLKQKIPKRTLQFGQWRLACRFPGLQA